jgi:outer membrane autotransporter protein
MIENSRFVREAALDRLRLGACGVSSGTTLLTVNDPHRRRMDAGCDGDRAVVWARVFGSWGSAAGDGNAARLNRSIGGIFVGADGQMFDGWRVGFLTGYSRSDFNVRNRNSSGVSDDYHLGVHAGTRWGNLAFRSGAAYTWHDISTSRSVAFPGFGDSLKGRYGAGTAQVFGELGYGVRAGAVTWEPFANLAYVNLHTGGFTERGGAAALTGRGRSMDTTFSTLGLRGSANFTLGGVTVAATGALGWRHAFGGATPASTLAFASGSSPFAIAGVPIAKDAAVLDVGLNFAIGPNATLGVSYNGQFGSGVTDNGVRANLRIGF